MFAGSVWRESGGCLELGEPIREEGRSGSHLGVILPPRGDSAMSGDIFICLKCVWGEAMDAAEHPTVGRNTEELQIFWPNMSRVPQLRNPDVREC